MRVLSKTIALILLYAVTWQSYADSFTKPNDPNMPLQGYKYCWMLGYDVDTQIIHPQEPFIDFAFNYRLGSAIYAAWRSSGAFGLELGYHWSTDKPKNITTTVGSQVLGVTATTNALYTSKLRVDDTYIDAYWHYKLKNIVELKLGVGVGFVRQKLKLYQTDSSDPVAQMLNGLYPGTTTVARFNIGLQTMLTRRIGARTLFGYQTTSSIKMRNVPVGIDPHLFSNSYMVSLGLFYTITGYYDDNPGPNGEFIN